MQKSMKSVGTIMSPRVQSKAGQITRKDNHGIRRPKYDDGKLPDIVRRGPINQKKNRTIVGLSLQNNQNSVPRQRKVVNKRNSIETTVRSNKPKAQARGAILRAQQAAQKFPQAAQQLFTLSPAVSPSTTVGSIDRHADSADLLNSLLAHQELLIFQQLLESLQWTGDCGDCGG